MEKRDVCLSIFQLMQLTGTGRTAPNLLSEFTHVQQNNEPCAKGLILICVRLLDDLILILTLNSLLRSTHLSNGPVSSPIISIVLVNLP